MAFKKAGEQSAQDILENIEKRKIESVKSNLDKMPTDDLEDFVLEINKELDDREPDLNDSYDLLNIQDIEDKIEVASKTWGKFGGIDTGFEPINDIIGGLKPAEVTLVAGESNNGKSAFIANIISKVAMNTDVLYFTLEMRPESVGARLKHMIGDDYKKLKIHFQKDFRLDYRGLEPVFKRGVEAGCKVAVLDYLQYMGVGMDNKEVAKMSRVMCGLAKEYNIPFIIVVSLRKGDKGRDWRELETEDIMGTGAIGYDADNIVLISRRDDANNYDTDGMWLKHLKSRDMPVRYKYPYVRFHWDKTKITTDENHIRYSSVRNSDNYAGTSTYKEWAIDHKLIENEPEEINNWTTSDVKPTDELDEHDKSVQQALKVLEMF